MRYNYLRRDTQLSPSLLSTKQSLNISSSDSSNSSLSSGSNRSSRDDFYHEYKRVETPMGRDKPNKAFPFSFSMIMILIFLAIAIMSLVGYVFWNLYITIADRIKSKKNDDDDEEEK